MVKTLSVQDLNEQERRQLTGLVGNFELKLLNIRTKDVASLSSKNEICRQLRPEREDVLRSISGARIESGGVDDGRSGQENELSEEREPKCSA